MQMAHRVGLLAIYYLKCRSKDNHSTCCVGRDLLINSHCPAIAFKSELHMYYRGRKWNIMTINHLFLMTLPPPCRVKTTATETNMI